MVEQIPLAPPSRSSSVFLLVLVLAFLAFLVYLYVSSPAGGASDKAPGLLLTGGLAVVVVLPIVWARGRRELILTDSSLVFRGGFYSRTLPLSRLKLESAQDVSLADRAELAPRWRTNGIALPGFRAGWFRLRNGDKALLYLTDPFCVTYLPTHDGFVLLLSTGALLEALRRRSAAATPLVS